MTGHPLVEMINVMQLMRDFLPEDSIQWEKDELMNLIHQYDKGGYDTYLNQVSQSTPQSPMPKELYTSRSVVSMLMGTQVEDLSAVFTYEDEKGGKLDGKRRRDEKKLLYKVLTPSVKRNIMPWLMDWEEFKNKRYIDHTQRLYNLLQMSRMLMKDLTWKRKPRSTSQCSMNQNKKQIR